MSRQTHDIQKLIRNLFAQGGVSILCLMAAFAVLPIYVDLKAGAGAFLWPVFVLAGSAGIALSLYLCFDALLFRILMASETPEAGAHYVDEFLARSGLRPKPGTARPLAARMAGTGWLTVLHGLAMLVCIILLVLIILL